MLVAGCSMLDKDFPIYSDWKYYQFVVRSFSKDYKSGKIPYFIQYPETSIQQHVVISNNHCRFQKFGSKFMILVYIDG